MSSDAQVLRALRRVSNSDVRIMLQDLHNKLILFVFGSTHACSGFDDVHPKVKIIPPTRAQQCVQYLHSADHPS